jgi:hypothetical protein
MKYLLLYYGQMPENEAERAHGMQLMADWYGRLGSALVDGGNPFVAARKVGRGTAEDASMEDMPTGYTIIEAADMEAATALARDCPLAMAGREITLLETLLT